MKQALNTCLVFAMIGSLGLVLMNPVFILVTLAVFFGAVMTA